MRRPCVGRAARVVVGKRRPAVAAFHMQKNFSEGVVADAALHQQRLLRNGGHQVRPVPEIIHSVDVTWIAVAMPFAAKVRLPVVPSPASRIVSEVIAIVMTPPA